MRDWINLFEARTRHFIRFGDVPAGERSTIGAIPNVYSRSARPGDLEAGVSVFDAEWSGELSRWKIVDVGNFASLEGLLSSRRPAFLVTGRVVKAQGIDQETLLRNVKIVKTLAYDEMWVEGWGSDGGCEEFLIDYDLDEGIDAKPPRLYPAVMVNGKKTVVRDKGATHFDALDLATAGMERNTAAMWRLDDNVRGFVNERGRWLNRYRAADYARAYDLFDRDSPNWCDWMATSPDLISEAPLK